MTTETERGPTELIEWVGIPDRVIRIARQQDALVRDLTAALNAAVPLLILAQYQNRDDVEAERRYGLTIDVVAAVLARVREGSAA